MFNDKRGQGLSVNAIILIILGLAVLVMLIVGFFYVWGGLGTRIQKDNIGTVISVCQTACSMNTVYDFCSKKSELIDEDGKKIVTSCYLLANIGDFMKFGLDKCPAIECKITCNDLEIDGKKGVVLEAEPDPNNYIDVTKLTYNLESGKFCGIPK